MQNNPTQLENLNQAIRKYNQALAYCQQGSLDLAVIQLKKVLSINPRFLRAHQLLALLYIQAEDWEKAKRELNKCGRIDVRNTTTLRLHEGSGRGDGGGRVEGSPQEPEIGGCDQVPERKRDHHPAGQCTGA